MTANVTNQVAYLRSSREFPEDLHQLTVEVNKAYVDTANAVNNRTIGIYPVNKPAVTGDNWYLAGGSKRQQTLRQVYTFTSAGSIEHGIKLPNITGFTRIYGTFTDGTNWYPLPYVDVVAANNQVNVIVTPTFIVITAGAGAPPAVVSGYVVIEWLSQA